MPWPTGSGRKASIPRLLLRLVGQWRFLPALSIDGLGYVLMVRALPALPVFVVQAAVAASLVVTAIAATRFIAPRSAGASGRRLLWCGWASACWGCLGCGGAGARGWGVPGWVGRGGPAWRGGWAGPAAARPVGRTGVGAGTTGARVAISADFRAGRSRQPVWLIVDALTRADSAHRGP